MRTTFLTAVALATGLTLSPTAQAQDLGKVIGGVAQQMMNQELDKAAYIEAQNANSVSAYRSYLSRYPNGIYAGNARQALSRLGAPVRGNGRSDAATAAERSISGGNSGRSATNAGSTAAQVEANVGLSRGDRQRIQQQLTRLGYNTRGADGFWGGNTRDALARWQRANGHSATGYITASQVNELRAQDGTPGAAGRNAASRGNDAQLQEQLLSLNSGDRREIQLRLTVLGYDTRGTDGVMGANTRNALKRWQGDHNLPQTGYLTADQVLALKSESRG